MPDRFDTLLDTLDLVDTGARTREDIFTGSPQWTPYGRLFGGQVLAQALIAAGRTIAANRPVHSMHGYFLRPGDLTTPITFAVDRIHDGNSFSTRRTQVYQNGLPILSMIASFQAPSDGLEHQIEMPADLPDPESLPTTAQWLAAHAHDGEGVRSEQELGFLREWILSYPFDMRYVTSPIFLSVTDRVAHQALWMRAAGTLPDDPLQHRAALVYASDYSILEPTLRRHGVPWTLPGLRAASLDHAMWWHRDGRLDDWVLYVQESPSATGGRGLSLGRIYRRDGILLATVAQEGMVRVRSGQKNVGGIYG